MPGSGQQILPKAFSMDPWNSKSILADGMIGTCTCSYSAEHTIDKEIFGRLCRPRYDTLARRILSILVEVRL